MKRAVKRANSNIRREASPLSVWLNQSRLRKRTCWILKSKRLEKRTGLRPWKTFASWPFQGAAPPRRVEEDSVNGKHCSPPRARTMMKDKTKNGSSRNQQETNTKRPTTTARQRRRRRRPQRFEGFPSWESRAAGLERRDSRIS